MDVGTVASISAAFVSALNLFILAGLERRVARLENFFMQGDDGATVERRRRHA